MSRPPNGTNNPQNVSRPLIQRPKTQAPTPGNVHSAMLGALGSMGYFAGSQQQPQSYNYADPGQHGSASTHWSGATLGATSSSSAMAASAYQPHSSMGPSSQNYGYPAWGAFNPALGAGLAYNQRQNPSTAVVANGQAPRTTDQGYTLSSTYVEQASNVVETRHHSRGSARTDLGNSRPAKRPRTNDPSSKQLSQQAATNALGQQGQQRGSSAAPNASRQPVQQQPKSEIQCSLVECDFKGTAKQVREHEEDRHLIFAPGREPKPWSGKLATGVVIEGTNMSLDTPEAVAQWIEERKKRWPTNKLVAEKEAQRQERIAAGIEAPSGRGRGGGRGERGRGGHSARGGENTGRGRGGPFMSSRPATIADGTNASKAEATSNGSSDSSSNSSSDSSDDDIDDDDDGPPEESSSKPIDRVANETEQESGEVPADEAVTVDDESQNGRKQVVCKYWRSKGGCAFGDACHFLHSLPDKSSQPAKPPSVPTRKRPAPPAAPHNPFAKSFDPFEQLQERDWQQVVENVLQVVEFLKENDWLKGVERRVGEMDEESGIEVLAEKKDEAGTEGRIEIIDRPGETAAENAVLDETDEASDNELVVSEVVPA
ncbi:hypothetical protein ACM66B_001119 [Microbotryomycetes sp. NB124-2]